MIKTIIRTIALTFLVCFTTIFAKAQVGYDYAQYDLGISVGFNQFYGDVVTPKSTKAVSLNFNYNQTPFLNYIFEAQFGKLAGGDSTKDLLGRQFAADYQYYAFRVQLQAGEILDYSQSQVNNVLKNFYVGTGIGIIFNNITSINRYSLQIPGYYTPGDNSGNQIFIPARIGYELKIYNKYEQPDVKIDIGYQTNFVLGDNLDGLKGGTHNDTYAQFTIGVKFSIGGITSYRKQITY
ncbi:MAG: hypothetical protein ABI203_09495 [Mucilaginibacter sp.]